MFWLLIREASVNKVVMFLLWKSVRRWRIVCVMDILSLFFFGVGARMRYLRCTKSHQNGADQLEGIDCIMASIVLACSWRNSFLLLLLLLFMRYWLQVERKYGGSWVKHKLMNSRAAVVQLLGILMGVFVVEMILVKWEDDCSDTCRVDGIGVW